MVPRIFRIFKGSRRDGRVVMISRMRYVWVAIGSLIGIYLTAVHYGPVPVACPVTAVINCVAVLHSAGSMLGPFPLALWGVIWAIAGAATPRKLRTLWMAVGIGGILWAIGHELALGQICLWCSAFQADIILVMLAWRRHGKSGVGRSDSPG